MTACMIERRYGRCNRDWLLQHEMEIIWTQSARAALIFDTPEEAADVLVTVTACAAAWPNARSFTFAAIEDRRHLPAYFASRTIVQPQRASVP
jgi:hypothetical protein